MAVPAIADDEQGERLEERVENRVDNYEDRVDERIDTLEDLYEFDIDEDALEDQLEASGMDGDFCTDKKKGIRIFVSIIYWGSSEIFCRDVRTFI